MSAARYAIRYLPYIDAPDGTSAALALGYACWPAAGEIREDYTGDASARARWECLVSSGCVEYAELYEIVGKMGVLQARWEDSPIDAKYWPWG